MALAMPAWGQNQDNAKVSIKAGDGITIATADEKYSMNIKSNFSAGVNLGYREASLVGSLLILFDRFHL